jgi:hypothetical protein
LRKILNPIRDSAAAEEASGFDPSGSSGAGPVLNDVENGREEESVSAKSARGWSSNTDGTSLSQGMSSLDLEGLESSEGEVDGTWRIDWADQACSTESEGLDDKSKELKLMSIFPTLRPFDINWTLKKCKGDVVSAINELMTQCFLEENGSTHRGIEAFFESDLPSRPRKGKRKKRTPWTDETMSSPATESPVQASKWETGKNDVEFITSRTRMPSQQISSLYHRNGASVHATISAILEAHAAMKIESEDPVIQIHAFELGKEFPSIPPAQIANLIQLTHPSTASAHELAKALISRPAATNGRRSSIQLDFRHAPIDINSEPVKSKPKSHNAVYANGSGVPMDIATAAAMAKTYNNARNTAFTQASAAYRKGKSDPLMGEAAAYYSEAGRNFDARAKSAESAAADALVASQSSRTELDLHGVNVKDAVRISRERVTGWWLGLGEARLGEKGLWGAYRIVTGVGNHSEGGRGKLGPAVAKMLIREGWKVEIGSGALVVTGVTKRK